MKALFIGIILLFSIQSFGQLEKKTWLIGGSGSFYHYNQIFNFFPNEYGFKTDTSIVSMAEFSTLIGYFPVKKLAVGLRLSGYLSKSRNLTNTSRSNGYAFRAGPFIRYYFLKEENEFNLLADVSYQFGYLKYEALPKSEGKDNLFQLMAGSEVFFNSAVGVEILVGYVYNRNTINDYKRNGFRTSIGFTFHLIRD